PPSPGVINKNEHYGNKPSWTTLFPSDIKILKPEQGYEGFKHADVVLNVRSSIGMEAPMFPTPVLNINSDKYLTNWPKSTNPSVMKNISLEQLNFTLSNPINIDPVACKE